MENGSMIVHSRLLATVRHVWQSALYVSNSEDDRLGQYVVLAVKTRPWYDSGRWSAVIHCSTRRRRAATDV